MQKGQWSPNDFGVPQASVEDLKGGDPETNAGIIRSVLQGDTGACRDIVVVNSAAALLLAHRASDLKEALAIAAESIDSGAARTKLEQLAQLTSRFKYEEV